MGVRFRLSRLAAADVDGIWDYTASNWSADQADFYLKNIFTVIEKITAEPLLGKAVSELLPGLRRRRWRSHFIFYRQGDTGEVEIVRVLHVAMDHTRHLGTGVGGD